MLRGAQLALSAAVLCVSGAAAQTSFSLDNFISIAESLGSQLGPQTTHSSAHSPTTTSTTLRHSTTPAPSTSATKAPASQTAAPTSSGGIDAHTRTIIIAVCVVIGLLLIGILIGCVLCGLRRRRRRGEPIGKRSRRHERGASRFSVLPWKRRRHGRQQMSEASTEGIAVNDDWSTGTNHHHGYVPAAGASAGAISHHSERSNGSHSRPAPGRLSEGNGRAAIPRPSTSEHPAFKNQDGHMNSNSNNPFVPSPPTTRKPLPTNRHNHRDGALVAGAVGLGGAAAYKHHQHNKHAAEDEPLDRNMSPPSYQQNLQHHGQHGNGNNVTAAAPEVLGTSTMGESGGHTWHDNRPQNFEQTSGGPPMSGFHDPNRRSYGPGFDDSRYSYDSHQHDSGVPLAAGAAALAGAGAVAHHEHGKHDAERGVATGNQNRGSYDVERPPTPFGLGAFGNSGTHTQGTQAEVRPGVLPRHGSIEPTVAASPRFLNTGTSGSTPETVVTGHDNSYPYQQSHDPPTAAQRRSLQERDLLASGPERQVQPVEAVPERNSRHASYGEASSSSSGNSRNSGSRIPSAALGAVGRGSPRVLASDETTSPLAREVPRDDEEAVNEHTPLSGTAGAAGAGIGAHAAAQRSLEHPHDHTRHQPYDETFYNDKGESSDSLASWRSARDSQLYSQPGTASRDPTFGLPAPPQPWAGNMPGAFPGERPAVPAYQLGGARHSGEHNRGSYSPVRHSGEQTRGSYSPVRYSGEHTRPGPATQSYSPALQSSDAQTPRQGTDYDPFSYEQPVVGSGRRSFGNNSPARHNGGGVVRFSDRNDEWRYDDGDDYSDRGGGGGNVYDGYRHGGAMSGRDYGSDGESVGRAL